MAKCIPEDGGYFDPRSKEKEMFDALRRALPDDFIIFHSFHLYKIIEGAGLNENEMDFLIFHPNYGCLFIEGKNRTIGYSDEKNSWVYYLNGKEKIMEDPFTQVFTAQHNLFTKLNDEFCVEKRINPVTKEEYLKQLSYFDNDGNEIFYSDILSHCKRMVALWLPRYTKDEIKDLYLGPTAVKDLILTQEHLNDIASLKKEIYRLMEYTNKVKIVYKFEKLIDDSSGYKNQLTKEEANTFVYKMLAPELKTVISSKKDYEDTYIELLEEQCVVLDFLKFQRTASISGCSGTGKTLVAVERARRLSNEGKKVLFLCYNRNLCDWLNATYGKELKENVTFSTLDSFACKILNEKDINKVSYFDFVDMLDKQFKEHTFAYKHIIVDEGQDFGKEKIESASTSADDNKNCEEERTILDLFNWFGSGEYKDDDTSFFIFYDKNQLVNSKQIPSYLNNVDSKLTLYKNCRNTKNIASTAFSVLNIEPIMFDRAWDGEQSKFIYYSDHDDFIKKLNKIIDASTNDRKIITCGKSLKASELASELTIEEFKNPKYRNGSIKTEVYTSATCKGLEAGDILLIDVSSENFLEDNKAFYVGASRAKKNLFIFINKNEIDGILNSKRFEESFPQSDKQMQIANELHGKVK